MKIGIKARLFRPAAGVLLFSCLCEVFLYSSALFFSGCATRPVYKSRSELIEEATESGSPVRTIEEDRALFRRYEQEQQQRVMRLVRLRMSEKGEDPGYRIGPHDEIEINVFDVPELNLTAPVRESGFLNLPLIGAVQATGKTIPSLTDEIKSRLSSFVRNPQVSLFVSHYGSQRVAVLGAVNKPDVYSLKKGANSIVELISEAGGLSQRAGNVLMFVPVEVSRVGDMRSIEERNRAAFAQNAAGNASKGIELYLDQVLGTSGGIPLEIPVRGGDMIVVPEGGNVLVEGEVSKIGSFELGQQMTLLGALAAAGGITYSANVEEVEVIRELGMNNRVSLVIDLTKIMTGDEKDVRLRNGDIIRVPSYAGRRLTSDTFEGIGKLLNFGVGGSYRIGP